LTTFEKRVTVRPRRWPGACTRRATAASGAIVNVASVAATIAFPGIAGYSTTKSAVDGGMECEPVIRKGSVRDRV